MRLLDVYSSTERAQEVTGMLRAKGIPTYGGISAPRWRLVRIPVYVCLDSQFADAQALLADPDHVVADPVDVAEFETFLAKPDHDRLLGWLVVTAVVVIGLVLAGLMLTGKPLPVGFR
jgi:hypothetical protein